MKRTIVIAGAALSLVLGAAAIAQTEQTTLSNPGTSTMQRAEDPANNAGLPGGAQQSTSTTRSTGMSTPTTSGTGMSSSSNMGSTSAGSYGTDTAGTATDTSSSGSMSAGMAGERG